MSDECRSLHLDLGNDCIRGAVARSMKKEFYNLWDIESLNVPRGYDLTLIIPSIINLLDSRNYSGCFDIQAVVAEYTDDRVPERVRLGLEALGVRFTSVKEKNIQEGKTDKIRKQMADKEIIERMFDWSDRCSDGVLVLFTCDKGYGRYMRQIQAIRNLDTILVYIPASLGEENLKKFPEEGGRYEWANVLLGGPSLLKTLGEARSKVVARSDGTPVVAGLDSIVWTTIMADGGMQSGAGGMQSGGAGGLQSGGSGGMQSGAGGMQSGARGMQRGAGGLQSGGGVQRGAWGLQRGAGGLQSGGAGGLQSGGGVQRGARGLQRGAGGLQRGGGGYQRGGRVQQGGTRLVWQEKK